METTGCGDVENSVGGDRGGVDGLAETGGMEDAAIGGGIEHPQLAPARSDKEAAVGHEG